jgi:MFS family permease
MQRIEKQVIAYTSVCHFLVHIFELAYGVVLIGIGSEFGVGLFALGLLANLTGFAFGLTALPAGFLADRIGERRLLILFCFASAIASVIVGVSPNIYVLGTALALLGLSIGIFHPVASAFLTKTVRQRGIAFGYYGVGGNLGVALGPLLAGAIASSLGWRAPYLVFAIPALATAFLLYFFKTEVPAAPQPEPLTAGAGTNLRSMILPLSLIFLASAMNGLIYRGLVTFLPLYLSEGIHFTFLDWSGIALAGSFTTVALIFGVAGQLLGGYLCERMRREVLVLVITILVIPLMLLMANTQGLSLMLTAIVLAFFHFMGQPIYNNLIADYSPVAWRGRSYGISYFFTFGIGSFSATFLGYIAERSSTGWIFITMAGISLLAFICVAVLLIKTSIFRRQVH